IFSNEQDPLNKQLLQEEEEEEEEEAAMERESSAALAFWQGARWLPKRNLIWLAFAPPASSSPSHSAITPHSLCLADGQRHAVSQEPETPEDETRFCMDPVTTGISGAQALLSIAPWEREVVASVLSHCISSSPSSPLASGNTAQIKNGGALKMPDEAYCAPPPFFLGMAASQTTGKSKASLMIYTDIRHPSATQAPLPLQILLT
ncbi:Hypothetical predicted protein, partial [Podarcis lilfordi]